MIVVFPDHTHLLFLSVYSNSKKILIIIAIEDLFKVKYVGLALSMKSYPLAGVHFPDTSVHFHLTGTHFVLHPQLISCIRVNGHLLPNYFSSICTSKHDCLPL